MIFVYDAINPDVGQAASQDQSRSTLSKEPPHVQNCLATTQFLITLKMLR
jgi:hypothetical protein